MSANIQANNSKTDSRPVGNRRTLIGVVVSDKMQKTIVVKVDRKVKHGQYGKYVNDSRKFQVHDEKGSAHVGDRVEIIGTRPLSRHKRWALSSVLKRASLQEVAS